MSGWGVRLDCNGALPYGQATHPLRLQADSMSAAPASWNHLVTGLIKVRSYLVKHFVCS